jgi:Flp pilus assembly protein TadG
MQLGSASWPVRLRQAWFGRRGAVSLLFATMIIPVVGLVGLAIDYGIWNEAYSSLSLAASAAALNAAKTAASADANADTSYISEGVTAGKQWFLAELGQGSYAADTGTSPPTVSVTSSANVITATVTYTSTVKSVFGRIYKKVQYPITVTASATMSAGSYLEVILMLDNSSSMGIGATLTDMNTLMKRSPCDTSNAWVRTKTNSTYAQASAENYSEFQTTWGGNTYDGKLTQPFVDGPLTLLPATPSSTTGSVPYCNAAGAVSGGTCQQAELCPGSINGYTAYAGPPCAFACHWDSSQPAGNGNDLWALARQQGVTLRLDTLKNATNKVLTAMKNNNLASENNLSVGIYTFNTTLNPIYPTNCTPQAFGCEAGSDWSTAISAVGLPPQTSGTYTDTGIQPPVASLTGNNDNTEVEEAMSKLANNYVTAAGDGSTASKPRKVLILITDGFEDDPTGTGYSGLRQAMPYTACTPFKTMGYTVYVIYTPYYPLPHEWYLANAMPIVEGSGTSSITYNLTACASNANDFIMATDQSSLDTALLAFLTDALDAPATFIR